MVGLDHNPPFGSCFNPTMKLKVLVEGYVLTDAFLPMFCFVVEDAVRGYDERSLAPRTMTTKLVNVPAAGLLFQR
jgi:hypothetical protein